MAQGQGLHGLEIAVAEFIVVGDIAPADASSLDSDL